MWVLSVDPALARVEPQWPPAGFLEGSQWGC